MPEYPLNSSDLPNFKKNDQIFKFLQHLDPFVFLTDMWGKAEEISLAKASQGPEWTFSEEAYDLFFDLKFQNLETSPAFKNITLSFEYKPISKH